MKLVLRGAVAGAVFVSLLACGAPPAPPSAAEDPIPLTGTHVKLDSISEHKYLHYAVGASIAAPPAVVWQVLTDAPGYPAWNSTVERIDGTIAAGERIGLVAKVAPDRTFELTVSTF